LAPGISVVHWRTRLSTIHTKTIPTRFGAASPTHPAYQILYLAENQQVALFEVGALLGLPHDPIPNPRGSWITLSLDVRLQAVTDLTSSSNRSLIKTTVQELTGDWLHHHAGDAPTQLLGAALFGAPGLEGFLTPSAKVAGRNLVVFPEKMQQGSVITFQNYVNGKVESLRP
jgi:hypothetical protein